MNTDDVEVVKVVKHYKDADEALDSISARLAERSLKALAQKGKTIEEVNRIAERDSNKEEHKKVMEKYSLDPKKTEEQVLTTEEKQEQMRLAEEKKTNEDMAKQEE